MRWVVVVAALVLSSLGNVALAQNVQPAPLAALDKVVMLLDKKGNSIGHGAIIGPNKIATVAHVAKFNPPLRWLDHHGYRGGFSQAQILGKKLDLAVLTTVDAEAFDEWLPIEAAAPEFGETVYFRLYLDDDSHWNYGHYIGTDKDGLLRLDAMAWPGSSGSGVLDYLGRLRGLVMGAIRPGYCEANLATLSPQLLVNCMLGATLARSQVEVVPVEAIR